MIDRDGILEFIEERKVPIAIVASAVLALCVGILVVTISIETGVARKKAQEAARNAARTIPPTELWIPEEPLKVPGVQLSREPRSRWSPEDQKRWYTVPDAEALNDLDAACKKQIDGILESVP